MNTSDKCIRVVGARPFGYGVRMPKPTVAQKIAAMMCQHLSGGDRSCGPCAAKALARVRHRGEKLIALTARHLCKMEGFTGEPTPLVYLAAADLLDIIVPAIRREPSTAASP